ncbi:MAG: hypothetical protein ACP5O0_10185 [Acidimicrobiales bacterium]
MGNRVEVVVEDGTVLDVEPVLPKLELVDADVGVVVEVEVLVVVLGVFRWTVVVEVLVVVAIGGAVVVLGTT